jgi:UDPglucose 6-dehydrogenase
VASKTIGLLGSPSGTAIAELLRRGARVQAYDPVAAADVARLSPDSNARQFADAAETALKGSDALVIVTEWKELRSPDYDSLRTSLSMRLVFDGRNLYKPRLMARMVLEYHCVCRPLIAAST